MNMNLLDVVVVEDVRERLRDAIVAQGRKGGEFVRVEVAVERRDVVNWVRGQGFADKVYWSDRADMVEMGGVGVAREIRATEIDRGIIETVQASGLRWFGGLRFDANGAVDPIWEKFGGMHFWLPRFELGQDGERGWLACHVSADDDLDAVLEEVRRLRFEEVCLNEVVPRPLTRVDVPDEVRWGENVTAVLGAFERGEADKVVLARKVTVPASGDLEPMLVLKKLMAVAPQSFHFCFQVGEFEGFVGASPERLYRRRGAVIESEALAGTRKRGVSAADDVRLERELLESAKERHEQELVLRMVVREFEELCDDVETDGATRVLKLAQLQHLYNRVSGVLRPGVTDGEIMGALHPTPAVGGRPREVAMRLIEELEPFDRGWYTGAVGWICGDEAEFAVAIRCALVEGDRLHAFSGAGIVRGSVAGAEWDEIENKLLNFRRALVD